MRRHRSTTLTPAVLVGLALVVVLDNVREIHRAQWSGFRIRVYIEESRALLKVAGPAHAGLAAALGEALNGLDSLYMRGSVDGG